MTSKMKIYKITTIERKNIAKGKHVVGILRPNKLSAFMSSKPHIPVLRDNGKEESHELYKSFESLREMYNELGASLHEEGGAFVLFHWKDVEIWNSSMVVISGGYIHTGDRKEGFTHIKPDEYCILDSALSRKTISAKLSEGGEDSEDSEDFDESLIDEDLGDAHDTPMTSWDESSTGEDSGMDEQSRDLPRGHIKVSSRKLLKLLDALGFECKEEGDYSVYTIYRKLFRFFVSKNLLLLSSLSAARIADDKWFTYTALSRLRTRWEERKQRAKEGSYAEIYPEHYYLPQTILGSDAIRDEKLLETMGDKVVQKFGNNSQWLGSPIKFVVKPRRGSLGEGIRFHENINSCVEDLRSRDGPLERYLVQEYILLKDTEDKSFDIRVLASGGKKVLAYKRVSSDSTNHTANLSQGGSVVKLTSEEEDRVDKASHFVIRDLFRANFHFVNLFNIVSDYTLSHPEYKTSSEIVRKLWDRFKTLYKSAWEWFGFDISVSEWGGQKHDVLIEVNISPGVRGPFELNLMQPLMKEVAQNLLGYCKEHASSRILPSGVSSEDFSVEYPQKEIVPPETMSPPTILILADISWNKARENILDKIPRLDARRLLESSQFFKDATIIVADIENLYCFGGRLAVHRGILLEASTFVEKNEIALTVDYLLRKKYMNRRNLDKGSPGYKSLISAGVRDASTQYNFARNISHWFEQQGGPTLITQPIIDVVQSKVLTEFAFRNYYSKHRISINRPKTYTPFSEDGIIAALLDLKKENFKGAVIKPSRGIHSHGIMFLGLEKTPDELRSLLTTSLPQEIRDEIQKKNKVVVQELIPNPFLINGKKSNLRTILTPIVESGGMRNINYLLSHTRSAGSNYTGNPDDPLSELPQDNFEGERDRFFLKDYLENYTNLDSEQIIEKIRHECFHALNAVFERAGRASKNLAFDVIAMDVLLTQDEKTGEVLPYIIEINSAGEIFRDDSTDDSPIMHKFARLSWPPITDRAKAFKSKRESDAKRRSENPP
ncbi:MAG: hypothetical protein O2779_02530 [Nanoarchaeota archaeon]|nr:hypothetical protein [Nanoarchaeota archaeon]